MVMDLQRTESRVMRGVLDNLGQSMFPRTMMVQGQANLADVRQTAIGAIIRVSQPNAVSELVKPFMGKEALPVMDVLEKIRKAAPAFTRASSGLTVDGSKARHRWRCLTTSQLPRRTVSTWSPAPWPRRDWPIHRHPRDAGTPAGPAKRHRASAANGWPSTRARSLRCWQCQVNVGGKGMPSERLWPMLQAIAQKQEQIMQVGDTVAQPLVRYPRISQHAQQNARNREYR